MPAYILALMGDISDVDAINEYRKGMQAIGAKHRGKAIAAAHPVLLAGSTDAAWVTLLEYPTREDALEFWNSEEYTRHRAHRKKARAVTVLLLDNAISPEAMKRHSAKRTGIVAKSMANTLNRRSARKAPK